MTTYNQHLKNITPTYREKNGSFSDNNYGYAGIKWNKLMMTATQYWQVNKQQQQWLQHL